MLNLERHSEDCIIACSSGNSENTAISLIRISGYGFLTKINSLFSVNLENIQARRVYNCNLIHESKIIDNIVLCYFKSPNSFNGEDILELSVHGNILNINRIIEIFNTVGIRTAYPGEFSYRALKNKKLSLNQVEGLDLLLNANSIFSLEQGLSLLNGDLQKDYTLLYDSFMEFRSSIELGFDFLEDIGEEQFYAKLNSSYKNIQQVINKLHKRVVLNDINIIDPEVILLGAPNAGKSTIFNNILGFERSIISDQKGTTRDFVSESIIINKTRYKLVDTAGIRDSKDLIETEGVKRSLNIAQNSFFNILIIDLNDEYTDLFIEKLNSLNIHIDTIILTHLNYRNSQSPLYTGLHKICGSIEPSKSSGSIEPLCNFGPIEPNTKTGSIGPKIQEITRILGVSTVFAYLHPLEITLKKNDLTSILDAKYLELHRNSPVLVARQKVAIQALHESMLEFDKCFNSESDLSILASEFNIVGNCISELTGIISPDNILENIFTNFCIGK